MKKKYYMDRNLYLVPLKVTPLIYNTLMPTFFPILELLLKCVFCYHQQLLLFRFIFYLLNRSKTHRCLQFWEEEKVCGGQVPWIRWLRHDYGFVFGQKNNTLPTRLRRLRQDGYWEINTFWKKFKITVIFYHTSYIISADLLPHMLVTWEGQISIEKDVKPIWILSLGYSDLGNTV